MFKKWKVHFKARNGNTISTKKLSYDTENIFTSNVLLNVNIERYGKTIHSYGAIRHNSLRAPSATAERFFSVMIRLPPHHF